MMRHVISKSRVAFLLAVVAAGLGCTARNRDADGMVPGSSIEGLAVYTAKRCDTCHSLPGEPRKLAPVLGEPTAGARSESDLLASLWNHAPSMRTTMDELAIGRPSIETAEMADLFALFYYLSVLDPAGDPERGRWLFLEKGCDSCHAASLGEEKKAGPALPFWSSHTTPARLAQAMWSHAAEMQTEMSRRGRPWTTLDGGDMADLVAYVAQVNRIATKKNFEFGDPRAGRTLFIAKRCSKCHSLPGAAPTTAPTVEEMSAGASRVGEMGALLWNHFPAMRERWDDSDRSRLHLSRQQMSDLFAFLFSLGYFDELGDAQRGRAVFESNHCTVCHEGAASRAVPLPTRGQDTNPIALATALWNHGEEMMDALAKAGIEWPMLSGPEVVDLLAYLRSRG